MSGYNIRRFPLVVKRAAAGPAPIVLPPTNLLYHVQSDLGTSAVHGTAITTLPDQGAASNDFVVTGISTGPTVDTSVTLNGLRTLNFSGSNTWLRCDPLSGGTITGSSFHVIVLRPNSLTNADVYLGGGSTGNRREIKCNIEHKPTIYGGSGSVVATTAMSGGAWFVLAGVFSDEPTADGVYVNNLEAAENTGSSGDNDMTGFTIGGREQATPGNQPSMHFAFSAAWSEVPSAQDITDIEAYLTATYSTAITV